MTEDLTWSGWMELLTVVDWWDCKCEFPFIHLEKLWRRLQACKQWWPQCEGWSDVSFITMGQCFLIKRTPATAKNTTKHFSLFPSCFGESLVKCHEALWFTMGRWRQASFAPCTLRARAGARLFQWKIWIYWKMWFVCFGYNRQKVCPINFQVLIIYFLFFLPPTNVFYGLFPR